MNIFAFVFGKNQRKILIAFPYSQSHSQIGCTIRLDVNMV